MEGVLYEKEFEVFSEEELNEVLSKTIDDYNNYKSARYLKTISGIATSEDVNEIVYYASTLVLSLGLGIIAIIFLELKRKKKI